MSIRDSLSDAAVCLEKLRNDTAMLDTLDRVADLVTDCFSSGGKVMAAGNGGSMADAMHFCEEWTGRFKKDRVPYPAMALADPTHLTCVSNDFGFEHVFARMVAAFGQKGDLLFLLSTSGNSENLITAATAARESGVHVVGFLGHAGGKLAHLCDTLFLAPGESSDRIQEIHMLCLHAIIDAVEGKLGH